MKPKSQLLKRIDGIEAGIGDNPPSECMVVIRNTGIPEDLKSYILVKPSEKEGRIDADAKSRFTFRGVTAYELLSTAPNGVIINGMTTTDETQLPDISYYKSLTFNPALEYYDDINNYHVEIRSISFDIGTSDNKRYYAGFHVNEYIQETGESRVTGPPGYFVLDPGWGLEGFVVLYSKIYAPYSKGIDPTAEYRRENGAIELLFKFRFRDEGQYHFGDVWRATVNFVAGEYDEIITRKTVTQNMAIAEKVKV